MQDVGLVASFLAGVIAFLSPCILPLIPGYLSVITRLSYEDITDVREFSKFSKIIVPSIVFVLGFSTVFISLGVFSSHVGRMISLNKTLLLEIAGIFIIFFGILFMGIIKIPFLEKGRTLNFLGGKGDFIGTYLLGLAFGFGWTPCVGPILGSILLYASTVEETFRAVTLLTAYSVGIGIPFILVGIAFNRTFKWFTTIRKYYFYYKYTVGGMLIATGLLMFSNNIYQINVYGQKIFNALGINFWENF